ncbi:MAG: 16S rRNA (uracil(1498)-N(3))-methyltransferase [Halioglobus sp.]|nr:16S rRNA (uracil(1498)-N(3))-methyltransferase [Halioglobus sp.]
MRIPRIHTEQELASGRSLRLEPGPSRHIARVLRLREGDPVILFDGRGGEYSARIVSVDRHSVTAQTLEYHPGIPLSSLEIHLGIAASRGDRMDWALQKSTELGVAAITPLLTERTGLKLTGERAEKKFRHWQQIIASACEQCGRCLLPALHSLQDLDPWLDATQAARKFILHPGTPSGVVAAEPPASVALLIGPEGGFSDAEIAAAKSAGFRPLSLGPRVLRTETAPLAAIAVLQATWGDMQPRRQHT